MKSTAMLAVLLASIVLPLTARAQAKQEFHVGDDLRFINAFSCKSLAEVQEVLDLDKKEGLAAAQHVAAGYTKADECTSAVIHGTILGQVGGAFEGTHTPSGQTRVAYVWEVHTDRIYFGPDGLFMYTDEKRYVVTSDPLVPKGVPA